jgi:hypothetical protein
VDLPKKKSLVQLYPHWLQIRMRTLVSGSEVVELEKDSSLPLVETDFALSVDDD